MGCNASRSTNVDVDEFRQLRGSIGRRGPRQLPVRRRRAHLFDFDESLGGGHLRTMTYVPRRSILGANELRSVRRSIGIDEDRNPSHVLDADLDDRNQRRRANLDLLRSEILSLERVFQTLIEQAFDEASTANPSTNENRNYVNGLYPPASEGAIQNLPTITLSSHDFEDGCNKECSICFIEFNVGDTVSRIPCGHLYHNQCISDWLHKKCTCPLCMWEIETNDALFEIERIQRMKRRRIKIKDHELERLCIQGLQDMAGTTQVKNRAKLIQQIKTSQNIDVITNNSNDCDSLKKNVGSHEGIDRLKSEFVETDQMICQAANC